MFTSISSIPPSHSKYLLIDSDFVEEADNTYSRKLGSYSKYYNIITDVYSKRNLNVAKNIVLFIKFYAIEYDHPISDLIDYTNRTHSFCPHNKELNKYLILL
jgi:hypothetical protein